MKSFLSRNEEVFSYEQLSFLFLWTTVDNLFLMIWSKFELLGVFFKEEGNIEEGRLSTTYLSVLKLGFLVGIRFFIGEGEVFMDILSGRAARFKCLFSRSCIIFYLLKNCFYNYLPLLIGTYFLPFFLYLPTSQFIFIYQSSIPFPLTLLLHISFSLK